ncbi:ricin-type beta-trefoil lectin domain protein [Streptomyces ferrugineus]|uniref:ricin-type beta-trefoil lectin domain protein n=1 Tax=Streptomyces ferrugineus TaxID=1413221 RepID=UPI001D13EA98|nr:ricin-type beta-trefoil lectin domain protein [Streptomyces ferrugineus]
MHDAGLSNSPTDARISEVTDAQLSAELKKWTGVSPALHPVGELLDRHWEAGFAYARLCTADARSAGMLTTAAFTRLFGETLRQTGPTAAWRPRLLVTVRRIAAEWDTDRRRELLHPELRSESEGAERAAARLLPPAERRLLSGAFQRVPQSARCLLWHTEVEAEPLSVPAALLGLDEECARVELGRARDRLREESLQVHRELAPEQECRQYLRMLDVTYRRGGVDVDPDLREHLDRCEHCSDSACQLTFFNEGLGLALAEAVLGWGAGDYLVSRASLTEKPAQAVPAPAPPQTFAGESFFADTALAADPPAPPAVPPAPAPEAFAPVQEPSAAQPFATADTAAPPAEPGPRRARRAARRAAPGTEPATTPGTGGACSGRAALKAARRAARRRNLTAAVATASALVVLPLVIWSMGDSGDSTAPTAGDRPSEAPGTGSDSATGNPSWAGAAEAAKGDLRGRLHNIGSGLCVGIVGGKAVVDAETELTECSSAAGQQWAYETDGLIRSGADPDLCLDSHLGYSVRLAPCTGAEDSATKNIRYDFTLQGTLVPRFNQDLALTPAATDGSGALVLKSREDEGDDQHWVVDTSTPKLQMEVVNWDSVAETPQAAPTPTAEPSKTPSPTPTPTATPTPSQPTSASPSPTDDACQYNPYACSWGGDSGSSGGGYGGGNGGYGYGYGGYGYGGYGYGGRR